MNSQAYILMKKRFTAESCKNVHFNFQFTRLCGLVVRVSSIDPEVLGSILGVSRFSEKQRVRNGVHSASWGQLRNYLKET
jgi:hypothetical protein